MGEISISDSARAFAGICKYQLLVFVPNLNLGFVPFLNLVFVPNLNLLFVPSLNLVFDSGLVWYFFPI